MCRKVAIGVFELEKRTGYGYCQYQETRTLSASTLWIPGMKDRRHEYDDGLIPA